MSNFIVMCLVGIVAAMLAVVLLAIIWCVLVPGFIIFAMKTFRAFDKLSDKLYSKFKK